MAASENEYTQDFLFLDLKFGVLGSLGLFIIRFPQPAEWSGVFDLFSPSFFFKNYLFVWLCQVLVAVHGPFH